MIMDLIDHYCNYGSNRTNKINGCGSRFGLLRFPSIGKRLYWTHQKEESRMAPETAVRGQREEEAPTRFAAWREDQRGKTGAARQGASLELEEPSERQEGEREGELSAVGLRLSRKDRERFEREAKAEGVTLSEYLRAVLHDLDEDPDVQVKQFVRDLTTAKEGLAKFIEQNKGMKASGFLEGPTIVEDAKTLVESLNKFCQRVTKKPDGRKESAWF
jgi:hypothetical protein